MRFFSHYGAIANQITDHKLGRGTVLLIEAKLAAVKELFESVRFAGKLLFLSTLEK